MKLDSIGNIEIKWLLITRIVDHFDADPDPANEADRTGSGSTTLLVSYYTVKTKNISTGFQLS